MADADGPEPDDSETESKPWGRRLLTGLIAVAALGGFAMVVVYSYERGKQAGSERSAAVIEAREGPTRIKPENPGGMKIPDQDKAVFDRMNPGEEKRSVEKLLPPPEPVVAPPPEMTPPSIPPVESLVARQQEMKEEKPAEKAEPAKPDEKMTAVTPPPVPEPAKAKPPPPPAQEVIKKTEPVSKKATAGNYKIQLASLRSREAANAAWKKLQAANTDILGPYQPDIVAVEIKNKGSFYRLRAKPLASADAARALCERLKARKIGCFIVRP